MKPQRRLLANVCTEINDLAERWHARIRDLNDGRDVTPELTEIEERLERLFAEKRWLKAGGLVVSKETVESLEATEGRLRMSLHKYRYSTAYDMPTIEMQLEGA